MTLILIFLHSKVRKGLLCLAGPKVDDHRRHNARLKVGDLKKLKIFFSSIRIPPIESTERNGLCQAENPTVLGSQ